MAKSFSEIFQTLQDHPPINLDKDKEFYTKLNNDYKYFLPENEKAYNQFLDCYKTCSSFANNHSKHYESPQFHEPYADNHNSFLAAANAYKLLVLFGRSEIQQTLQLYDQFLDKYEGDVYGRFENVPVETRMLSNISLPRCIEYNKPHYSLNEWKEKLQEFGFDMLHYISHLSRIEQHLSKVPETVKEFKETLPVGLYRRYDENPALAKLANIYKIPESTFNLILETSLNAKYPIVDHQTLPDIVLNMSEEFVKLKTTNLKFNGKGPYTYDISVDSNFDLYENTYFVKLPETDLRSSLFRAMFDEQIGALQSLYVIIKKNTEKSFDPYNINWDNLEQDGHQIIRTHNFYVSSNGQLFIDIECFQEAKGNYCEDIIGAKLLEFFPDLEVILEKHGRYFTYYNKDELYNQHNELYQSIPIINGEKIFALHRLQITKISQIEKMLSLDIEYLSSIATTWSLNLLLPFIIDQCNSSEEIKSLHSEITAFKETNPARYESILKYINDVSLISSLQYHHIKDLPDETIDFFATLKNIPAYISLPELLENTQNPAEVKHKFLKLFITGMFQDPDLTSKIDQLSAEDVNNLCQILNSSEFRLFDIMDFIDLDSEVIEQLTSELSILLYVNGINYKSLLEGNPNVLTIKQNIISSAVRIMIDECNYVQNLSIDLYQAIAHFSSKQVDYLMQKKLNDENYNIQVFVKLVEFMAHNPNADASMIQRHELEIQYILRHQQNFKEGLFQTLSPEHIKFLQNWKANYFFKQNLGELEWVLSFGDIKLMALIVDNTHLYSRHHITPMELASFRDPFYIVERLKEDCYYIFTAKELDALDTLSHDLPFHHCESFYEQ